MPRLACLMLMALAWGCDMPPPEPPTEPVIKLPPAIGPSPSTARADLPSGTVEPTGLPSGAEKILKDSQKAEDLQALLMAEQAAQAATTTGGAVEAATTVDPAWTIDPDTLKAAEAAPAETR